MEAAFFQVNRGASPSPLSWFVSCAYVSTIYIKHWMRACCWIRCMLLQAQEFFSQEWWLLSWQTCCEQPDTLCTFRHAVDKTILLRINFMQIKNIKKHVQGGKNMFKMITKSISQINDKVQRMKRPFGSSNFILHTVKKCCVIVITTYLNEKNGVFFCFSMFWDSQITYFRDYLLVYLIEFSVNNFFGRGNSVKLYFFVQKLPQQL